MTEDNQRIAPAILFHSFLIVAGAYVANLVLLFVIANIAFPDAMSIITGDPAEFKKIVETDPDRVFPPSMFVVLLIASGVTCFGLGNLVVRFAPVGKFSHAIFFAAVLFAQYLQLAIGAEQGLKTKLILFMAISPIAALLGANSALGRKMEPLEYPGDD